MAVSDERLMAYLDGELAAADQADVEAALAADPELRRRLAAQQHVRERLASHYDPVLGEAVPTPLRAMLETRLVDLGAEREKRARRGWPVWQQAAALAAMLVLGMFLGRALPGGGSPVAVEDGRMVARGELAESLDSQLASAQPADAATRIGVTFARADGRLCRTFESATLSGLACRGDSAWELEMTVPGAGGARSEYRQAASGSARVLQAAQEMMASEPLDAAAERVARDRGWRP